MLPDMIPREVKTVTDCVAVLARPKTTDSLKPNEVLPGTRRNGRLGGCSSPAGC